MNNNTEGRSRGAISLLASLSPSPSNSSDSKVSKNENKTKRRYMHRLIAHACVCIYASFYIRLHTLFLKQHPVEYMQT